MKNTSLKTYIILSVLAVLLLGIVYFRNPSKETSQEAGPPQAQTPNETASEETKKTVRQEEQAVAPLGFTPTLIDFYDSHPRFGLTGYTSGGLRYGDEEYQIEIAPLYLEEIKEIAAANFPCEQGEVVSAYKGSFQLRLRDPVNKYLVIDAISFERQIFHYTEQESTFAGLKPIAKNPIIDSYGLAKRLSCFDTELTLYGVNPKIRRLVVHDFVRKNGSSKKFIIIPKGVKIPQQDSEGNIIEDKYDAVSGKRLKTRYRFDVERNKFFELESWLQ